MKLSVLYQKIEQKGFPVGSYYAHLPELGLTTHGLGLEGAKAAAIDLAKLWIDEKRAQGEPVVA